MRNDPEVIADMEEGDAERLHAMQTSIEGLIMKFDTAADELDRMVEQGGKRSCLSLEDPITTHFDCSVST